MTKENRSITVSKFTGGVWNDATNYDLCLNSGKLGFERCAEAIEAQLKIMLNK